MPLKIFAYAILVMILLSVSLQGKAEKSSSRICYFVAGNSVQEAKNSSWSRRQMTVLLDSCEFTEAGLRDLASELFNKYPKPENLGVGVFSDVDQIPTETEDLGADPSYDKYPHGIILRTGENEIIRYAIPPDRNWKTIVLKGKD